MNEVTFLDSVSGNFKPMSRRKSTYQYLPTAEKKVEMGDYDSTFRAHENNEMMPVIKPSVDAPVVKVSDLSNRPFS